MPHRERDGYRSLSEDIIRPGNRTNGNAADDAAIVRSFDTSRLGGRGGSIHSHSSSFGQNRFLRTIPSPVPKTNQDRIVSAE